MNILPQQLIGKIVKDCYQTWNGDVVIEFSDGTKIKIDHKESHTRGHEVSIPIII